MRGLRTQGPAPRRLPDRLPAMVGHFACSVELLDIGLDLVADDASAASYVAHRLSGFARRDTTAAPLICSLVVCKGGAARAARLKGDALARDCAGSRRVFACPGLVYMDRLSALSGVTVSWRRTAGDVRQETVLADRWWMQRAKRAIRRLPPTFQFEQLTMFAGLYPILFEAERRGWHPVHAGLVGTPRGGGVLIVGPAGSGKSTLTLALSLLPGYTLLSDNLVLSDGAHAIGVPEPVKLDARAAAVVRAGGAQLHGLSGNVGWGRIEYAVPSPGPPLQPAAIVLPRLGSASGARLVSADDAAKVAASANHLAFEIEAYYRYAAALALGDAGSPAPFRVTRFLTLARQVPIVALDVRRDAPLDEALAALTRVLPEL